MTNKDLQLDLGSIATGSFYEFQRLRIDNMNRIRNVVFRKVTGLDYRELQEKKTKTKEEKQYLDEFSDKKIKSQLIKLENEGKLKKADLEYIEKIFEINADTEKKEKQYNKLVEEFVQKEMIWTEMGQYIKGMGTLTTAMLLYYFGYCEKARYASSLWKFAGLTPDSKFKKGETGGFNPKCRMMCWRLGDSFIKQRNERYRPIYDKEKARQLELMKNKAENAPTRLGHADARARRKMVKFFLADYYRVCKTITNQEQHMPYVIEKMGHTHFDDVLVYLEKKKKQSLNKG